VRASNIGGTSAYCGVKNFRTILSTPVLHSPSNNSHQLQSVQFDWLNDINVERFYFQLAEDSLFNSIVRSDTLLTDTTENIAGLILGSRYFWRVRAERTESISEWSEIRWFDADVTTMNMPVNERWNIISLPLISDDLRKVVLFPDANSSAFSFSSSGYVAEETLKNGVGYWLKFDSAQSVAVNGTLLNSTSVEVQEGWNLIGSLSQPLAVTEISSTPGGIVTSEFYEYQNGYTMTDTLYPGEGYWVKSSANGTLTLSSLVIGHLSSGTIRVMPTNEFPPSSPEGDGNGLGNNNSIIPREYVLEQNYPNPFNPTTIIRYQLPVESKVSLKIFDVLGREVSVLVDDVQGDGYKELEWNVTSNPSGLYFLELKAVDVNDATNVFTQVRKLVVSK
jgi:hypothetical protein